MLSEGEPQRHQSGEHSFLSLSILPAPVMQELRLQEKDRRKREHVDNALSPLKGPQAEA